MTFSPSPEQSAFFDVLRGNTHNILLSACAGSGKTTTIVEALKLLPERDLETFLPTAIAFLAFNKSIAETLKARCPRYVSCATFHSLGLRALKDSGLIDEKRARSRDFIDSRKVSKKLYNALGNVPDTKDAIRLASVARSVPIVPEFMDSVFLHALATRYDYSFDEPARVYTEVQRAIMQSSADLTCLDFDEMLYLPVILGARFAPQDYVFVDEAQDTNDIQLEILARLAKPSPKHSGGNTMISREVTPHSVEGPIPLTPPPTRYTFVGDPHQAIYGFRGANSDSMSRIAARFTCTEMPLSISFRCPQAVVAEAQKYIK